MATTTETLQDGPQYQDNVFESGLQKALSHIRNIDLNALDLGATASTSGIPALLSRYCDALKDVDKAAEAEALDQAREKAIDKKAFGGLGLGDNAVATPSQQAETLFLVEAWLEAINSKERAKDFLSYRSSPAEGTRPMTLAQKVFAQH